MSRAVVGDVLVAPDRDPICPWCRQRHPYGLAYAYDDRGVWRCSRCDRPLDGDGDCGDPKCCQHVNPRQRNDRSTLRSFA